MAASKTTRTEVLRSKFSWCHVEVPFSSPKTRKGIVTWDWDGSKANVAFGWKSAAENLRESRPLA